MLCHVISCYIYPSIDINSCTYQGPYIGMNWPSCPILPGRFNLQYRKEGVEETAEGEEAGHDMA